MKEETNALKMMGLAQVLQNILYHLEELMFTQHRQAVYAG